MRINRLTTRQVATLGPGWHADGGGLWLRTKDGRRSWVFRYTLGGRQHYMGLGPAATVSLAEARAAALEARKRLREGRDLLQRMPKGTPFQQAAELHRRARA